MALVREPKKTLCCDDEFAVETATSFSVLEGADSVMYDEYLHHSLELQLPAGVLGAEPGNANASAFALDSSWTNAAGVSSSSSSFSPVTFDGHGEEYCAAWMNSTDQPSYGALAPRHTAGSSFFSFEGGNRSDAMPSTNKRPHAQHGAQQEAARVARKQCRGKRTATERAKVPRTTPPREPQTAAAKNRRERVNERLKVLQELVPNGRKVDTATMLDKAITYVKFMQLQIRVLEMDAFWPTQGGKTPDMSQVKEALGALLSVSSSSQLI